MRFLLDTHALLWWIADAPELSAGARRLMEAADHEILVSAVSGWEISVKYQLGKLELAGPPEDLIPRHVAENGFAVLPVSLAHGLQVCRIPLHHRDPFDRMLIAQSQLERVPLISRDPAFAAYDVEVLW